MYVYLMVQIIYIIFNIISLTTLDSSKQSLPLSLGNKIFTARLSLVNSCFLNDTWPSADIVCILTLTSYTH